MCNITLTSVGSVLNFAYAGVLVGYVAFTRLRVRMCNITMTSVDSVF
jgi:hypothetical protein